MLELWKKYNVKYAEFEFSCGGDSMNDEVLRMYDKQNVEIIYPASSELADLEQKIINSTYDNVNFYVNSDGHYIGEYGTVTVQLNEDNIFEYIKNATSEYIKENMESIDISDIILSYDDILKYISQISGNNHDCMITYSKDFILTEELKTKIANFKEALYNKYDNFIPDITDDTTTERFDFFTNDNKLNIFYSYIITEPSE